MTATAKSIIFLPGIGCDAWLFNHQIETLQHHYNTHTLPITTYQNLDDYLKSILELSPDKVTIVGHAFGGWLGQWLAIKHPDRVDKLVLITTGTGRLHNDFVTKNMTDFNLYGKNNPFAEFFKISLMANNPFTGTFSIMNAMKQQFPLWNDLLQTVQKDLQAMDTSDHLQKITCPTLLLQNKNDLIFTQDMALLSKKIAHSCSIHIDVQGPFLSLELPELVTGFIQTWLR